MQRYFRPMKKLSFLVGTTTFQTDFGPRCQLYLETTHWAGSSSCANDTSSAHLKGSSKTTESSLAESLRLHLFSRRSYWMFSYPCGSCTVLRVCSFHHQECSSPSLCASSLLLDHLLDNFFTPYWVHMSYPILRA